MPRPPRGISALGVALWLNIGQNGVALGSLGPPLCVETECKHFLKERLTLTKQERGRGSRLPEQVRLDPGGRMVSLLACTTSWRLR